ncbi:hypothetical protein HIM_04785 [Hirsutella minnesotensis 3608]|uniref:Enterotoxin n=1 Tax=Hirsutella minnesotensis 3608 TaxID=1043627 RepID=A0A0F7ZL39_9HYPO|nr:hypothetical protein HIM_04785 [Hirsutella minnesotensis 3608]
MLTIRRLFLSLVLWATVFLLLGPANGAPQGGGPSKPVRPGPPKTLQPKGLPEIPSDAPLTVLRGEHGRTSGQVYQAGGLYARGYKLQHLNGSPLSAEQLDKASNILQHVRGFTKDYTRYVSTTTSREIAQLFASDTNPDVASDDLAKYGVIYECAVDAKVINAEKSIPEGKYPPQYLGQEEYSVAGGIPTKQIKGTYQAVRTDDQYVYWEYTANPQFDQKYLQNPKDGGAQPDLATEIEGSKTRLDTYVRETVFKGDADGFNQFWVETPDETAEARKKQEEEARKKQEEEARKKEEEARKKQEEEARKKQEEEAREKQEEEARKKQEEAKAQEVAKEKAVNSANKLKDSSGSGSWVGNVLGGVAAGIGALGGAAFATGAAVGTAGGVAAGGTAAGSGVALLTAAESISATVPEVAQVIAEFNPQLANEILLDLAPSPPSTPLGPVPEPPLLGRRDELHDMIAREVSALWAFQAAGPTFERAFKQACQVSIERARLKMLSF